MTNMKKIGSLLFIMVLMTGTVTADDKSEPAVEPVPTFSSQDPCERVSGLDDESRPRRRPGYPVLTLEAPECVPGRVEAAEIRYLRQGPTVPDRWRIVDTLGYESNLWDPYSSNNPLKADRPVIGKDWFFNLLAISDTVYEPRTIPTPVGSASTNRAGSLDVIGDGKQYLFNQNVIIETVLYKGDTVYKPPDHEFRLLVVGNWNLTEVEEDGFLKADPSFGTRRSETGLYLQQAFYDYHIRDVSPRYDFESIRFGIQPFSNDFRGFLFQDQPFGVRFFGIRDNAIWQYNVAWFRRLDKDINSGLNDVSAGLRDDDLFVFNLYKQDAPSLGFTSEFSVIYNRNREGGDFVFDANNFLARPASIGLEQGRDYDVAYLGYNGDGHFGPWNLSASTYFAIGEESQGTFVPEKTDIFSYFLAAEGSRDFDWTRLRLSFAHASGDNDPFDNDANGFDAIFDNPQFAGGETSYWIRQGIPYIGGGKVALTSRNSLLPNLRSSKEQGQSNFTNPGLTLLGVGADFDLSPQTRLSLNFNQLWFADTSSLEFTRAQEDISKNIGQDISAALIWRPYATQNIVFRLSGAILHPGSGWKDLYGSDETLYSVLGNLILAY